MVSMLSVPVLMMGPPVSPAPLATLVTVPLPVPVPGNVCPVANVICPLLAMCSPVSEGLVAPSPNSRFSVPEGAVVSLLAGSASHWKV